jgi:Glycosyltransferase sugar-binding region containing DXD motif
MPIPPVAHFVWFGRQLQWVHLLAFRSAALRGGFARVVLHHSDDLSRSPWWAEAMMLPGFETRALDPEALLARCPRGVALVELFRQLEQPAARANMIRIALLYLEGGVFLDTDTVTLQHFGALLQPGGGFCGSEHVIGPWALRQDRSIRARLTMLLRSGVRSALRELPGGWRLFRRIERLYPVAVNNAVFGSEPGHALLADLLARMAVLPAERRQARYALGTHLLQQAVAAYPGRDFRVLPPHVFYPLGPEISVHWFRRSGHAPVAEVLRPETRLVHWYASVRTDDLVRSIDPASVRAAARSQLFSALALPFLEA